MVFKLGHKPPISEENVRIAEQNPNVMELKDGTILEKQSLGVFRIRKGDRILAGLDIKTNRISFYELKMATYKTRDEKSDMSINIERGIVLELETLETKMLRLGRTSYTAQLGREEIPVEDYIEEGGTKYFYSFIFEPGKTIEQVKDLLKLHLVKEDLKKIRAINEKTEVEVAEGALVKESPGVWKAKDYAMRLRELDISREGGVRVKYEFPRSFWLNWDSRAELKVTVEFVFNPETLKITEINTSKHSYTAPFDMAAPFNVKEVVEGIGVKIGANLDSLNLSVKELLSHEPIENEFEYIMGFKPKL
jgi:hypothetical protein